MGCVPDPSAVLDRFPALRPVPHGVPRHSLSRSPLSSAVPRSAAFGAKALVVLRARRAVAACGTAQARGLNARKRNRTVRGRRSALPNQAGGAVRQGARNTIRRKAWEMNRRKAWEMNSRKS